MTRPTKAGAAREDESDRFPGRAQRRRGLLVAGVLVTACGAGTRQPNDAGAAIVVDAPPDEAKAAESANDLDEDAAKPCAARDKLVPSDEAVSEVRVSHILISHADAKATIEGVTRSRRDAEQLVTRLLRKLCTGDDFGRLAREYSDGPTRSKLGDIGTIRRGQTVPEFEAAAFSLLRDEFSDVVETKFGFHLILRTQ